MWYLESWSVWRASKGLIQLSSPSSGTVDRVPEPNNPCKEDWIEFLLCSEWWVSKLNQRIIQKANHIQSWEPGDISPSWYCKIMIPIVSHFSLCSPNATLCHITWSSMLLHWAVSKWLLKSPNSSVHCWVSCAVPPPNSRAWIPSSPLERRRND